MPQRINQIMILCLVAFVYLTGRMGYYQLIQGPELAQRAAVMRSREIELREYPRGNILDRNHLPLTNVRISSAAYLWTDTFADQSRNHASQSIQQLAEIIGMSSYELKRQLAGAKQKGDSFILLRDNLTAKEISAWQEADLPGLVVAPLLHRYRLDGFCVHLLGYVDKSLEGRGMVGIEKHYDSLLAAGDSGQEMLSIVDGRGQVIAGLHKVKKKEKLSGSVVLTIDRRIQEIVENTVNCYIDKGAVVVMDIESRDIVAMASRPAFNPYEIKQALSSPGQPLLNRALTPYHPGSLFKIVVSIAALEEHICTPGDKYHCEGEYTLGEKLSVACMKKEGHGNLTMEEAFACSCNPCFIQIALDLGQHRLMKWVDTLHLTDPTITGLPGYSKNSYVCFEGGAAALANVCLGQQGVMLTPVQIASLFSTVADDGQWVAPRIVASTIDQQGVSKQAEFEPKQRVMQAETAAILQRLLRKVVAEGTGQAAAIQETAVAGKTATAQTGRYKDEKEILNTWFAGYLPADKPRWVIVVLVEEGESGAQNSAPVFRDIARQMVKYSM